jgi:hypothetical protein
MQISCPKVYVFNVTNKDDWLKGGGKVKLKVQEVGPLIYRQVIFSLTSLTLYNYVQGTEQLRTVRANFRMAEVNVHLYLSFVPLSQGTESLCVLLLQRNGKKLRKECTY